jgi:hypothetical protein
MTTPSNDEYTIIYYPQSEVTSIARTAYSHNELHTVTVIMLNYALFQNLVVEELFLSTLDFVRLP